MSKKMDEKKALKAIKVKDFAELAPENVGKFVSVFAEMDPEVAKKALEQIPDLAHAAREMVAQYGDMVSKGLDANKESVKPFYEACQQILDSLDRELQKGDLTQEDRDRIIEHMMTVAKMMGEKDQQNKQFIADMVKAGGKVVLAAGFVLVALVGGKEIKLPLK